MNIRNRSYVIGALVDLPGAGAQGVLFSHGSPFGGHALYVKDNRLHYVYNFVGMAEQKVDATEDLPTGEKLILSASFDKSGEDPPGVATGLLSLWHGDTKVGRARSRHSPASSCSPAKGSASGVTAEPASRPTTRVNCPGGSPAARSIASPSTSAVRSTSIWNARQRRW